MSGTETLFDKLLRRGIEPGMLVLSRQGHDAGRVYLVMHVDGCWLSLCDGKVRPVEKPKRKRNRHVIALAQAVSAEQLQTLAGRQPAEQNRILRHWIAGAIRQNQMER